MNLEGLKHVFREYDIRGKSFEELDFEFARRLGWAYAEYLKAPEGSWVAVGRDVRLSSEELFKGLCQGLNEAGLNVYDIGTVPTPVLYFSLFVLSVAGGIMITASHNPPDENGFKICKGQATIASEDIEELYWHFKNAKNPLKNGKIEKSDVASAYRQRLLTEFSHLREGPSVKFVVDAGNGAAGPIALTIFKDLGIEFRPLFCEPDGRFPNHIPDPTVARNLQVCSHEVRSVGFDAGIGFDGDGDRLGVVDEKGNLIFGDRLLLLFARDVLESSPGAKIVAEVKCTSFLFEEIKRLGGVPIIWKAGHSLIKRKMAEENALLGGEMSGHYFFRDRYYGFDDAIYASLRFIEIAKKAKKRGISVSDLLSDMPNLYATEELRIPVREDKKVELVEELKSVLLKLDIPGFKLQESIFIDGIRLNYDHGWALLRPSNTQAVIVARLEADSQEGLKTLEKYFLGTVESKIREYD